MPAELVDLLDVCAAIYLSDRQAPRAVDGDLRPLGERWHRRIDVRIPVRRPDRWRSPEVGRLLEQLTVFLSDDEWTLTFVRRDSDPRPAEAQAHLFASHRPRAPLTLLHGGGLDSLFGLIEAVTSDNVGTILAVSVVTHSRLRRVVDRVLGELRLAAPLGAGTEALRLHIEISRVGRSRDDRESSQRTRSLLYLAAGVVATILSGGDALQVTENGPGAINLPCTPDQIGSRVTRAMHPKTLALVSDLAALVLGRRIRITNTGLFQTKRELARVLADGRFVAAARRTVSCDRFPYLSAEQGCGTCGSCLYRRIALNAPGVAAIDDGRHKFDLLDSGLPWDKHDLMPLVAQRELVERLRRIVASDRPFAALDMEFSQIDDVVAVAPYLGMEEPDVQSELVRLFKAYVRDADAFFARIDRPDWGRRAEVAALNTLAATAVAS